MKPWGTFWRHGPRYEKGEILEKLLYLYWDNKIVK
jgi:hypothetical protein